MPVFLFHGDDTYTHREKLRFWQQEFEKKYGGDINVNILSGRDATAQELFQICSAVPFLGEKRFTVIKNFLSEGAKDEITKMAELLEKIPDFCVLIFSETGALDRRIGLYKKIQKQGKVMEFPALTGSKLIAWIEKTVGRCQGKIEKEATLALTELLSGDLYRLENEIAKLAAYARGREITKADIDLLVDVKLETSIFRLTDGIGQKNTRTALLALHQLIETGEELPRILYMIMRQFRIILCVKDLAEQRLGRDEIVSKLKEHPFVISNTLNQAKNFSTEQLARAYELLIDIDTKLKTGGIKIFAGDNREFVLALDRLVLELCN